MDDRNLPQVKSVLPLLVRGVGIHHGGLLPIIKETIEILFQEGLLKILFATDSPWAGQKEFVQYIKELPLTEEEQDRIFRLNALELLGLSE